MLQRKEQALFERLASQQCHGAGNVAHVSTRETAPHRPSKLPCELLHDIRRTWACTRKLWTLTHEHRASSPCSRCDKGLCNAPDLP